MTNFKNYLSKESSIPSDEVHVLKHKDWAQAAKSILMRVREGMKERKKFLLVRELSYFANLIEDPHKALLGCFSEGTLVGITGMVMTNNFQEAKDNKFVTYPDGQKTVQELCGHQKIAVIQSLCVLTDHGRKGLCSLLMQKAIAVAQENGCAHVFAQVAAENVKGRAKFEEQGFSVLDTWDGDHKRCLLWRKTEPDLMPFKPLNQTKNNLKLALVL